MLTYKLPDQIREIAEQGEFDEFDLNEFFRADDSGFLHEEYVQSGLTLSAVHIWRTLSQN